MSQYAANQTHNKPFYTERLSEFFFEKNREHEVLAMYSFSKILIRISQIRERGSFLVNYIKFWINSQETCPLPGFEIYLYEDTKTISYFFRVHRKNRVELPASGKILRTILT